MQEADDMLIVTNKMTSTYTRLSLISKSNAKHVFKLHVPINNLFLLAMSSTNREKQVIIVI